MTQPADLEDRLKAALRAEAAEVAPDPGSLAAIRSRGRTVRRRRRAAVAGGGVVALAAVALAVPALDRTDGPEDVTMSTSSTDGAGTTPTTEDLGVLSGGGAAADLETALWPDPAGGLLYRSPVEAARSFVEAIVGEPVQTLSDFRPAPDDPAAGAIDVERWEEDGTEVSQIGSTLTLRRLDEHWFVTAASSADVRLDAPPPTVEVTPPFHVSGRGRGFEGALTVELLTRSGSGERLASVPTTAGADDELEPFGVILDADVPAGTVAIVVVRDEPGEGMLIPSFAAVPVRLGAAGGGP